MSPAAHQPALVLTQSGTEPPWPPWPDSYSTEIRPSRIRYPIDCRNAASSMSPAAHQPALVLTQSGTADAAGVAGVAWPIVDVPTSSSAVPTPA